jgi:hypothetical protein
MAQMRFITPPPVPANVNAHWILYPDETRKRVDDQKDGIGGIMIGDPWKIPDKFLDRELQYLDLRGGVVEDIVHSIKKDVMENKIVYVTESSSEDVPKETRKRVTEMSFAVDVVGCFIKCWFYIDSTDDVFEFLTDILKTRICLSPRAKVTYGNGRFSKAVESYKRPLKVLITGDRNSSTDFEEFIAFELKSLPAHSIVIHGGCYGIDKTAHKISIDMGIEVRVYPAEWDIYGKAAGPIRNKKMLTEENPDLVLAFHPDIETSKGTKNMILQAYGHMNTATTGRSPEVYIHSLKRKTNMREHFESYGYGDFANM